MPTITDIKSLKRRQSRFSVYVDGMYAFGVSDLELSAGDVTIGQELSLDELHQWQEHDGLNKAISLVMRFVAVRSRSRKEILDYLARKGVDSEPAGEVLERLEKLELVDDVAFAEGWVAGRQKSRPRSRRVLAQELAAKGVPNEIVSAVLDSVFDTPAEAAAVAAVIAKKQKLPQYRDSEKLIAYLMRQGYPYDLVKREIESRET
jgi:regulatory protein